MAKRTGDVTRNPVRLKQMVFEQENFWTAHFGGTYLFRSTPRTAITEAAARLEGAGLGDVIEMRDTNRIARFLADNALVEPIIKARGIDGTAILRQKMDFIVVDAAHQADVDLTGATRRDIRRLARRHADDLPPEYHALRQLVAWAEDGARWPRISSDHPAYFYTLRASDHADADLVNMLLAELAPKDVRQLFICHKALFYRAYAGWSETKKSYVADMLAREYAVDKAGTRAALFGHEPGMEESPAPPPPPRDDMIARVGPWGAVRRERS